MTRAQAVRQLGTVISIDEMGEEEGALLLLRRAGSSRAVEWDSMPSFKPMEQGLHGRRWGQWRPAAPIASEHDPGFQPSAYRPQRHRPGHLWTNSCFLVDFFSPLSPSSGAPFAGCSDGSRGFCTALAEVW